MQCNTVSLALDALNVLHRRGFCWRLPPFLLVWVVLCFSACSFSELNTAWTVQRSYAEKPTQGSQEQRGRGRTKRRYHLFEIKEGRICVTSGWSALCDCQCCTNCNGKDLAFTPAMKRQACSWFSEAQHFPSGVRGEWGEQKAFYCNRPYIWPYYQEPASPAPPSVSAYSCRG